jgi:hypothetical protein
MAFKKFLVCADNHGNLVNKEAVKKLKAFKSDFKPHYTVHLGDPGTLRPLGREPLTLTNNWAFRRISKPALSFWTLDLIT